MLVFKRKAGERVCIGDNIVITVVRIEGQEVRLGFEAPIEIPVHRSEVKERIDREEEELHGQ